MVKVSGYLVSSFLAESLAMGGHVIDLLVHDALQPYIKNLPYVMCEMPYSIVRVKQGDKVNLV